MKKSPFNLFSAILIISIVSNNLLAQNVLTGQINSYAAVLSITNSVCSSEILVNNSSDFSQGEEILIIQMKGASIDQTNSSSFGSVTSYNDAGKFELARIANINGNSITLEQVLCESYNINGSVQIVSVPEYNDAVINSIVSAQNWNGSTGGVIIMDIANTLTINGSINASGTGFRGGTITNNPSGSCGSGSFDYFYDVNLGANGWSQGGAEKGEGIAFLPPSMMGGKGSLGNGGGGGNKHNTGGGGGGNFSSGGGGGDALAGCLSNPGFGGENLVTGYNDGRLFMGGGGGCGDQNDGVGSSGANGGGIVIILANAIISNNATINVSGLSQIFVGGGIADGAGGGGAGGSILIQASSYTGNLNLIANGGNGGNQNATWGCVGPGGGGGAGIAIACGNPFPQNVSTSALPGQAGTFQNSLFSNCSFTSYGAESGVTPTTSQLFWNECFNCQSSNPVVNLNLINDTVLCTSDILSVLPYPSDFTSIVWNTGETTQQITVDSSGIYTVCINSSCATICDTAYIERFADIPSLLPDDTLVCSDQPFLLDAFHPLISSYLWNTNATTPSIQVNSSGHYLLNYLDAIGCQFSDSSDVLMVSESTQNLLNESYSFCDFEDPSIAISPVGSPFISWSTGSQEYYTQIETDGLFTVSIDYGAGCIISDSTIVEIVDCETLIYIPNAFSPDGDGINDTWFVQGDYILRLEVQVFNRWGNSVYDSNDQYQHWDGTFQNKLCPDGIYTYKVRYQNTDRIFLEFSGHINLIR